MPGSKEGRVEVEPNQLKNSRSEAKLLPLCVTCLLEFFPESRLLASVKQEFFLISWACVETASLTQNYRNHINRQNQDRGKHCKDFEVIQLETLVLPHPTGMTVGKLLNCSVPFS